MTPLNISIPFPSNAYVNNRFSVRAHRVEATETQKHPPNKRENVRRMCDVWCFFFGICGRVFLCRRMFAAHSQSALLYTIHGCYFSCSRYCFWVWGERLISYTMHGCISCLRSSHRPTQFEYFFVCPNFSKYNAIVMYSVYKLFTGVFKHKHKRKCKLPNSVPTF